MTTFVSYNPATGATIGTFPLTEPDEVSCALEKARELAEAWRSVTVSERCDRLRRLRDNLASDADVLASIVSTEIGKPLQEAYGADLLPTISGLDWLGKNVPALLKPRSIPGARHSQMLPEPYGIVGVIGTWNYPLLLDIAPIAWALAAGNVVVWKPSELAMATAMTVMCHFERALLPVVCITGDGSTGRALCQGQGELQCDKVAFTGGVSTGRAILAELAEHGIPSVMELSGNDAMLVCADADVQIAARSAVWARCSNAGQSCVAPQRIYVVPEIYKEFVTACRERIEALRPELDYGPLRTSALRARIHGLVFDAVSRGAKLVAGGSCLDDRTGFYYAPTLLADCTDAMPVVAEDFFGPVLAVCRVQNTAEALVRINADSMRLGASIWTRDVAQGKEIAAKLRVGTVAINTETMLLAANPALPFGGFGASGFGKQRGATGLEEFVQWKTVSWQGMGGVRRHLFPYKAATLPILRGMIALKSARTFHAKIDALRGLTQAAKDWNSDEQS